MKKIKQLFSYLAPIWSGNDNKPSLRSIAATLLIIDFVRNVHNSTNVVVKVLSLVYKNKIIDPALVSALSGNLAQIVMILGLEAGLITALLALKTYQNGVLSTADAQQGPVSNQVPPGQ